MPTGRDSVKHNLGQKKPYLSMGEFRVEQRIARQEFLAKISMNFNYISKFFFIEIKAFQDAVHIW